MFRVKDCTKFLLALAVVVPVPNTVAASSLAKVPLSSDDDPAAKCWMYQFVWLNNNGMPVDIIHGGSSAGGSGYTSYGFLSQSNTVHAAMLGGTLASDGHYDVGKDEPCGGPNN